MATERWVLLGLASSRAAWLGELTRWSTSGALPAELVKCISVEELRARLASGRPWSAVLVDTTAPGLDRDLVDAAGRAGAAVLAVRDRRAAPRLDPLAAGVVAVLPANFGRDELLDALELHARPVGRGDGLPPTLAEDAESTAWRGRLVVVCGPGGTGASTLSVALSQGLAGNVRYGGRVALADLALRADQAVLHDATELGPGLQELVEAHRLGAAAPAEVVAGTFAVPARGYRLLLGLRRPSAWSALRPRATTAAIDGLRRAFAVVVADVTGDVEGEAECGSSDVEERNHLARTAVAQADLVLAVGAPGLLGVHALAVLLRALGAAGVSPTRLLPVVNRARRDPRARSQISAALADLAAGATSVAGPVWVRERRVEDTLRDGRALPSSLVHPLTAIVEARLDQLADLAPPLPEPARVPPGALGGWADER